MSRSQRTFYVALVLGLAGEMLHLAFSPLRLPLWYEAFPLIQGEIGSRSVHLRWGASSRWLFESPGTLQRFDDGCGAAVLSFLLQRRGLRVPQTLLWNLTRLPSGGTTLPRMARIARSLGMSCTLRDLSGQDLQQLARESARWPLPCILHLRRAHFVALLHLAKARALLFDPAIGFILVTQGDLLRHVSGLALVCDDPPAPLPPSHREPPRRGMTWRSRS